MLTIAKLQNEFTRGLHAMTDDILQFIQPSGDLSAQEHLDIYRSSIIGALQKVLTDIYPVCEKLVGHEFFIHMINEYIAQTPSISADLGDYGHALSDFIQQFSPADSLPYLSDVAKLEWAWHRIFTAANNAQLDFTKLASCLAEQSERIIFSLPAESFLFASSFPVHKIWEVNQEDYLGDRTIRLEENRQYYFFIWRNGLEMRIEELAVHEWQILVWIKERLTLGDICDRAQEFEVSIVELLPELVKRRWLVGFVV